MCWSRGQEGTVGDCAVGFPWLPSWTALHVLCRASEEERSLGFSPAGGGGGETTGTVSALKSSESNPGPRPNPKITVWKRGFLLVTRTWHHSKWGAKQIQGRGKPTETHWKLTQKRFLTRFSIWILFHREKGTITPPSRTLLNSHPSWENQVKVLKKKKKFPSRRHSKAKFYLCVLEMMLLERQKQAREMDEMDVPKDQVNATPRTCPFTHQTSQSTSRTYLVHRGGKQDSFKRFFFFF